MRTTKIKPNPFQIYSYCPNTSKTNNGKKSYIGSENPQNSHKQLSKFCLNFFIQPAFTCSKSTTETPDQYVKKIQAQQ